MFIVEYELMWGLRSKSMESVTLGEKEGVFSVDDVWGYFEHENEGRQSSFADVKTINGEDV